MWGGWGWGWGGGVNVSWTQNTKGMPAAVLVLKIVKKNNIDLNHGKIPFDTFVSGFAPFPLESVDCLFFCNFLKPTSCTNVDEFLPPRWSTERWYLSIVYLALVYQHFWYLGNKFEFSAHRAEFISNHFKPSQSLSTHTRMYIDLRHIYSQV